MGSLPKIALPPEFNTEAHRMIAGVSEPTAGAVDTSLRNVVPFHDVFPGISLDNGLFVLPDGLAGVGLGGWLPPGAVCILGPAEDFNTTSSFNGQVPGKLAVLASAGNYKQQFGPRSFILRAGEAVSFGRKLGGPLTGMFAIPGDYDEVASQFGNGHLLPTPYPRLTKSASNAYSVAPIVNDVGVCGPTFSPMLRLFVEPGCVPRQISYTPVPRVKQLLLQGDRGNFSMAASGFWPGTDDAGSFTFISIPPGVTRLTMALSYWATGVQAAGTSYFDLAPLAGNVRTFDVQVYWYLSDGIRHLNPADQWTVAARGQAGPAHCVEEYDIPGNAIGIDVWTADAAAQAAPTTASFIMSEG